jgi:predicted nicotinamide N-methyase
VTKTSSLGPNEKFDVLVAADCCYMPLLQTKLLQSIDMLLSEVGVALLPFALHGNASDQEVWGILDRAEKLGFVAEVLEERQLTPSVIGMEDKRSLVQTVRLTRHIKP